MRLIDADALKKEFPKDTDWEYPTNTNEYVCEKIDAQPTVQPETNCSEIPNNSDTISRQQAIEAIHEDADWLASQGSDWQVERMERDKSILKSLPSVQPETNCSEIPNNSDTISRQQAINKIKPWLEVKGYGLGELNMLRAVINELENMPSAQPDIIRCKDCKWYGRADKRRFYRGMDCLQKRIDTIVPDRDFCSRAERREDATD